MIDSDFNQFSMVSGLICDGQVFEMQKILTLWGLNNFARPAEFCDYIALEILAKHHETEEFKIFENWTLPFPAQH